MKPIGQIASAYGPMLDVYHDPDRSLDPDECYFHTLPDCMTLAGVHGEGNRERCTAEFQAMQKAGGVTFDVFLKHGGMKMRYLPLPKPGYSWCKALPPANDDVPVEGWITSVLDCPTWVTRARVLQDIVAGNFENAKSFGLSDDALIAAYLQLTTAALEHLAEKEVSCIQAAAFYALSLHDEWASVGLDWLRPVRQTWFQDWVKENPTYRRMAFAAKSLKPTLPAWISGGAND